MKNNLIEEYMIFFENLKTEVLCCADCYQKIKIDDANRQIIGVIDRFQKFITIVFGNDSFRLKDLTINKVNEKLNEILKAFENQDYILIGDLLEYELAPIIDSVILSKKAN